MTKTCGYCQGPVEKERPVAFGAVACSAICEMALCDLLDGCSISRVEAWVEIMKEAPREILLVECKQRQVEPD
jgi:hypothetical protein